MKIIRETSELQKVLSCEGNGTTGFVPTMGALHDGHISLVKKCRTECNVTVVSIFVNPTQFNDPDDLKNYPRTPEKDIELLDKAGVDILFMPEIGEIYPEEDTRVFSFGQLDTVMEGERRPGHFNGVAQIVSKLFDIVQPDRAYFGEKDFQQLAIIRALVRKLGYDIEIIGCPIKRDSDGLALSSRNALLTPEQRAAAPDIYKTMRDAVGLKDKKTVAELCKWVTDRINENPQLEVEYFTIVDSLTLQPVSDWNEEGEKYGCIAVSTGNVRLIDNMKFS
ncbi:MAG: pantoate--beta-alanine ligase [Rikenellaceae bacterium]|nr:pantoate--beta-alanine ligase [Rikenellaceae bacterium]